MVASISTRAVLSAMLAVAVVATNGCASSAGGQAPIVRQTPSASPAPAAQSAYPAPRVAASPTKEHLPEWMERHRDLTPEQQQQALQSEPGFHQLPAATQQRMLNRLAQLNSMPQQQRQRVLERAEEMEHLSPGPAAAGTRGDGGVGTPADGAAQGGGAGVPRSTDDAA